MLLVFVAVSCRSKNEVSIENLDEQEWDTLGKGFSYISTEDHGGPDDALVYTIIATMSTDGMIEPVKDPSAWVHHELMIPIYKHAPNSSSGFVRVNVNELLQPDTTRMNIYISEPDEIYQFKTDSAILVSIQGIRSVRYISKTDARKKWLDEGNADWDKVLEENPLPAMIEVDLDKRYWTASALDSMKSIISANIKTASDIQYPVPKSATGILYHYFEYKKK